MTKDEALKMAIDVLQNYAQADSPVWRKALNACKEALKQKTVLERDYNFMRDLAIGLEEALEQPAQEPVAWIVGNHGHCTTKKDWAEKYSNHIKPLYTHPHQWQGLTDDEIGNLITPYEYSVHPDLDGLTRAIEQALKEKNT
jgi:hypothetical protein